MIELIAKIMLLAGIGGLVGLFAYHQFRTQHLSFQPWRILRETSQAVLRAFHRIFQSIGSGGAWLRRVIFSRYTLAQPRFSRAWTGLIARTRRASNAVFFSVKSFFKRGTARFFTGMQAIRHKVTGWKEHRREQAVPISFSGGDSEDPTAGYDQLFAETEQSKEDDRDVGVVSSEPNVSDVQSGGENSQAEPMQNDAEKQDEKQQEILQEKERALLREVAERPTDISLYKKLGFLYLELGREDEARQSFQVAIKLGSQDAAIQEQLEQL